MINIIMTEGTATTVLKYWHGGWSPGQVHSLVSVLDYVLLTLSS